MLTFSFFKSVDFFIHSAHPWIKGHNTLWIEYFGYTWWVVICSCKSTYQHVCGQWKETIELEGNHHENRNNETPHTHWPELVQGVLELWSSNTTHCTTLPPQSTLNKINKIVLYCPVRLLSPCWPAVQSDQHPTRSPPFSFFVIFIKK